MANYFSDFPEKAEVISKHSYVRELVAPLEAAFGDPELFKDPQEAIELYDTALAELGKFCATEVAPTAAEIDSKGTHLKNGEVIFPEALLNHMKQLKQLGIFTGPIERKFGGMNMPKAVSNLALELLGQACPNTAIAVAVNSMADFLQRHGNPEQIDQILPRLMNLEWTTSMALTEAGAGSDLGKLTTHAVKHEDHYIINGTKRFISNGSGDISFVLARSDSQSLGLEGLSVFIVPKKVKNSDKENFIVTKLEDKICLHASPTCEMVFENSVGYLIGEEGQGFKVMLDLMNQARTAMATIAVGISASALDQAKQYAKTRVTMGKPIIEHPMVADMLFEMEIEVRAMRSLIAEASCADDYMRLAKHNGDEKSYRRWRKRYLRLTPLVKYFCSERVVIHTRQALQIFGGYGVCKEYPAERLVRESLIYPIYEGTSQIQSLMVLKDTLKDVAQNAPGFLGSLAGAWAESKVTRDPIKSKLLEARNELNIAIKTILMGVLKGKFRNDIDALREKKIQDFIKQFSLDLVTPDTDLTLPFLFAERLTRIVCDYYLLKTMVDHHEPNDQEHAFWILEFAKLALPRMRLENELMQSRLPSTLEYIRRQKEVNSYTA